jgi:MFS family permease
MNDTNRPQPSRLYRWLVLVFISLAMFGNYYVYDCIGPLAYLLSRQLGFSDANIGLLQGIYSTPNIVMPFIGGVIIDRIGTKRSTLLFGTVCFAGAVLTALTPQVAMMAAGRLVFGLGAESLIVAITTAIARWFRGKELGFAFGINLMIARSGSLAAQVSPTWAPGAYTSWQWPLLIAVAFGALCIAGAVVYALLEGRAERRYQLGEAGKTDKIELRHMFQFDRSFWYISLLCVTFYSAIFPFQTFAQKYFVEARGVTLQQASLLVGMLTTFTMFGTPLFGLMADRLARRSLFMMLGALLLMPVYYLMGYTQVSLGVPMAMMGVAFSLVPAIMWPSVAYLVPEGRLGTAYGMMTLVQNIGMTTLNFVVGWTNDAWGAGAANPAGYRPGMVWAFSGLGFLALFFAFLLRRSETGPRAHGLETITAKG